MTRSAKRRPSPAAGSRGHLEHGTGGDRWRLHDAKVRFSELVRRANSDEPQRVTVHGRDEVVVISAEEYQRLKGTQTGQALIAAMQATPDRDLDIEPRRETMPVRDVDL